MSKRGQVDAPAGAAYLQVSPNGDAFGVLWKKRIILGWYPGKTTTDAYLACFVLENINWKSGEFQIHLRDNRRHTTRSLGALAGIPQKAVSEALQRWEELRFIGRYAPGPRRPGVLTINWGTLRETPSYTAHLTLQDADLTLQEADGLTPQASRLTPQDADLTPQDADRAPLYKDNHSIHSFHLGEGTRSAPSTPPFAGANPSDKDGYDTKGIVSDKTPPKVPRDQVLPATIKSEVVLATSKFQLPENFGSDMTKLNPFAETMRRNRRYGGLAALDGSEGVIFDLDSGTLDVVNGTRTALEREAADRGLDLRAALVKAAARLAKDPRSASPVSAIAEIRQALQYQVQDKRKSPTKRLSFGQGGFGRNFKGI